MSSTRNRNMRSDYCLESKTYKKGENYNLFENKRVPKQTMLPCAGVNVGYIPSNELAWNAVNIESQLFGIGASNMIQRKEVEDPRVKKLDEISFFERMDIYIPEPLALEKKQRPNIFRR